MSDPVPHNRNRLGHVISLVFHPLVIFIPTLVVVLKDADLWEAVGWLVFIAVIILALAAVVIFRLRRRGQHTYQRETRHIMYLSFWVSMVICVGLGIVLDAPIRLVFSLLCLIIWVPAQYVINARYTKISVHAAVISGIVTALFVMGDLSNPFLLVAAVGAVLATAWARLVTGNHSLVQVTLGIVVSISAVLVSYGIMALWHPL